MRAPQLVSNYGCNRDRTGGDRVGRLRCESVRFVRDGGSRLREPGAYAVCASRLTCVRYVRYVRMCLVVRYGRCVLTRVVSAFIS